MLCCILLGFVQMIKCCIKSYKLKHDWLMSSSVSLHIRCITSYKKDALAVLPRSTSAGRWLFVTHSFNIHNTVPLDSWFHLCSLTVGLRGPEGERWPMMEHLASVLFSIRLLFSFFAHESGSDLRVSVSSVSRFMWGCWWRCGWIFWYLIVFPLGLS